MFGGGVNVGGWWRWAEAATLLILSLPLCLCPQVLPHLTPDAPAIVVSHGMAMRCFLRGLLQSVPTMSRLVWAGSGAMLGPASRCHAVGMPLSSSHTPLRVCSPPLEPQQAETLPWATRR